MRKVTLCLSLIMTLLSGSIMANPFDKVDEYILNNKGIIQLNSGTAVAVVKGDEVIYEGYFGYSDIQNQTPVNENTVFYIASMTKAFYALNTLLMEHSGKVDTNTTLNAMFPDIDFKPAIQSDKVTITDLLRHTSGIDSWPLIQVTAYTGQYDNDLINQLLEDSYVNPNAPLGTFDYTNVGYNILSHWMDNTFETNWQTQLATNIFKPLGMNQTSALMSDATSNDWALAKGYSVKSPTPTTPVYLIKTDDSMHAAGGMITTAQDMAKFLLAQVNGGILEGTQVIPKEVIAKSHESLITHSMFGHEQSYGWGWFNRDIFDQRILEHRGGYSGASTYMSIMPEKQIGLVVLSNQDKWGGDLAYALEKLVYAIALDKPEEEINEIIEDYEAFVQESATRFYENKSSVIPEKALQLNAMYVGNFSHDTLGNIVVSQHSDGTYLLKWGSLQSALLVGNAPHTLSVEFLPNSIEDIVFMQASDKQRYLKYREYWFKFNQ
ncbi:serine hydrolase domain-containing protein [Alteromonas sp. KUL49]|uniref:serine hydrolase domain-containing protein n=1 Tax=Alteromonas sp. KUL49 TaxID=2480798 RepID=UPI00102EE33B|nr:serine hydrolase domain-containing protein [Alteromonas sp. KUL49]TAP41536.1 class A beta-lactamase-related serine hydrolase [Alteromonas sp. KUL49]GEA10631.1 hypothetical protein KUL49_10060 [Alteromonas sp. KUL49]